MSQKRSYFKWTDELRPVSVGGKECLRTLSAQCHRKIYSIHQMTNSFLNLWKFTEKQGYQAFEANTQVSFCITVRIKSDNMY